MKQSKLTSLSLFILHQQQQVQLVNANNNDNDGNGVNLNDNIADSNQSRRNNRKRRLRGGQDHTQQQIELDQLQQLLDNHHQQSIVTANNPPQHQHYASYNNNHPHTLQLQRAPNNNNHHNNNNNSNNRKLNTVSPQYLQSHPYYPHHDALTCYKYSNNQPTNNKYPPPPEWMTWSGGYAEAHLFKSGLECCLRWFPDVKGCVDGVAEDRVDEDGVGAKKGNEENEDGSLYGNDPANWDINDPLLPSLSSETSPTNANIEQMSGIETTNNWHLSPEDQQHDNNANQEEKNNWADQMVNSLVSTTTTTNTGGGKVGPSVEYTTSASTSASTSGGGGKVGPGVEYTPNANNNEPDIFWAVKEEEIDGTVVIGSQQSNFDQLVAAEARDNGYQDYLAGFANHGVSEQGRGHGVPLVITANVNEDLPPPTVNSNKSPNWNEQTFPTSSCGTGWSHATTCSILCLSGSGCPTGQTCFNGIPCPATQVATAMGNAGSAILQLINANDENLRMNSVRSNVCGKDYAHAEASCMAGEKNENGSASLGYSDDFERCGDDQYCSGDLICYGDILCPLPPTVSPVPTRSPVREYTINHGNDNESSGSNSGHGKSIVAYYAAWQWYDRSKLAQPRNLNYHMVTRINYAFFNVNSDGEIYGTDEYADGQILFGDSIETIPGVVCSTDNSNASGDNDDKCYCHYTGPDTRQCGFHDGENSGLIYLAHDNNVEVYVSVGGWTLSEAFPVLAGSQGGREKFAESCVKLILEYNFDGIDIDWEYPGFADHGGTSADKANFVLLLKTVRSALDALGLRTDQRYGLTAALPCGPSNIANQDIQQVSDILDELNLMTYDFHGAWDQITGHNAPLYDQPSGTDPESGWSVNGCVEAWVGANSPNPDKEQARSKVNIGLPFYGRSYLDTTELYKPHGGNDEYSWYDDHGTPQFFHIQDKLADGSLISVRDDDTKTPWAYFSDGYGMISYDDQRSICDKVEYVQTNGLGGFIIWDLSGDMMDDLHQPLLEAVNRKLALPDINCKGTFGVVNSETQVQPDVEPTTNEMIPMQEVVNARVDGEEVPRPKPLPPVIEEPLIRGDKTEILGIPVIQPPPPPAPRPVPVSSPAASNGSPYTIDRSTFGGMAVAASSCAGGCPSSSTCVGNSAGGQLIKDEECSPCNSGQTWWPCDVPGLCWCWADGTDRIAPAPASGVDVESSLDEYYTVCDDILTPEMFKLIAPEAKEPYTYQGLCDAILSYNAHHTEKAFGMGSTFERTAELAAFLGNTLHESDEFRAGREYLMCADNLVVGGEVYCKPCDPGSFDWGTKKCNFSLVNGKGDFNEYCQPSSKPPEACHCGDGAGAADRGQLEGYVAASHLYFGRGAIQLSWNYNYIGASVALTGSPDTFCDNPDVVATEGRYAWGAGIYFWMEHTKELTTSHMETMNQDFGGSLNNINGGLECPAHGGWHVDAVKARLNRYCRAANALGLPNLMRLDNCAGLQEAMDTCLMEGKCDDCKHFVGTSPGVVLTNFVPAKAPGSAQVATTETTMVEFAEPAAPVCPEGLMPWEGNSECCVPNSAYIGDGACDPEAPYNTAACGYDGGDCCKLTCDAENSAFGCTTKEGDTFGRYGPFGFYCVDPSQGESIINSRLCDVDEPYRIGDGQCNPMYNTPGCNYDGGDCCDETCDDYHGFYECGSGVQSYVCLDPAFNVVETGEPTNRPTPNPTPQPTPWPTQAPQPTGTEGDGAILTGICPMDMLQCANGEYKSRNSDNGCAFDPCPEPMQQQSSSTAAKKCKEFKKECPNGTFVGQNPDDNCKFFPCPEGPDAVEEKPNGEPQSQSSNASKQSLASSIASSWHGKGNSYEKADEQPKLMLSKPEKQCNKDRVECSDGSFVTRDASNNCKFLKCPELPPKPTFSLSKSKKCNKDRLECQNGSFVVRDPSSNCKFLKCPSPVALSNSSASNPKKCKNDRRKCPGVKLLLKRDPSLNCKFPKCSGSSQTNSLADIMDSSSQQPVCKKDKLECSDGSFVSRSPLNNCKFTKCPKPIESLAATVNTAFGGSSPAKNNAVGCTRDIDKCSDGSWVGRNSEDDCNFFPCPDKQKLSASINSSLGKDAPNRSCDNDVKACPDGTTLVGRDPDDNCRHYACPASKPASSIASMAGTMHNKYSAPLQCTNALFKCPSDGHYVGQDPDNNCEWYPCNVPGEETQALPNQQVYSGTQTTISECAKDLFKCETGTYVGRDPDDDCSFYPCELPDDEEDQLEQKMAQMMEKTYSTNSGVGNHQKTRNASRSYSQGRQAHRKKRNGSRSR